MKYVILLCAFILSLVGAVCVFCTRMILKDKKAKNMNKKVKSVRNIGWIILMFGLIIIYFATKLSI
ncbi:MAG: hypothetical protein RR922_00435 [Clostridia bacterium]